MKKFTSVIFVLLLMFVASCSNNDDNPDDNSKGPVVEFKASPDSIEASAMGETIPLNISFDKAWTVESDKSWIHCERSDDGNAKSATINVKIDANDEKDNRKGYVIVQSGQYKRSIVVLQWGVLQLSEKELFSTSVGEKLTFTVKTKDDWNVTSDNDWIKAEKTDSVTVTVTTDANTAKLLRSGSVTVNTTGNETAKVAITQDGVEDTQVHTPEGYELVWSDEFNKGYALNSDWSNENWNPGTVNGELQSYITGARDGQEVAVLNDGKLNITCFKASDENIYSARVCAKNKEGWKYGYFEARILLPKGKGTNPGFLLLPVENVNWPQNGQIDVMEEKGSDPNAVYSTIFTNAYKDGRQIYKNENIGDAESQYHIYGCEWTPDYVKIFIDGKLFMKLDNDETGNHDTWPFDGKTNFYPSLHLAWGGTVAGVDGVDEDALPATMRVDYIRVFQKIK